MLELTTAVLEDSTVELETIVELLLDWGTELLETMGVLDLEGITELALDDAGVVLLETMGVLDLEGTTELALDDAGAVLLELTRVLVFELTGVLDGVMVRVLVEEMRVDEDRIVDETTGL